MGKYSTYVVMQTKLKIPHLSYILNSPMHKYYKCIVANGDLIDKIDSLDEFYKEFGYTAEIAKTGILADEFIWDNYVKDRSLDACLQMHIVQYLIKHSLKFKELYVHCYEEYVKGPDLTHST
jgi:hypothetical protein